MEQIKFYKYCIALLIFLNVSILAFFFFTRPRVPHRGPHSFKKEVVETLKLDAQQENQFHELAENHSEKMQHIRLEQANLLHPYFESIAGGSEAINKESMISKYQELEIQKLEVTNEHFKEIKRLLTPNQMPHFKVVINNFIDRVLFDKKKIHHRRK